MIKHFSVRARRSTGFELARTRRESPLDLGDLPLDFSPTNHIPSRLVELVHETEDLQTKCNRIVS